MSILRLNQANFSLKILISTMLLIIAVTYAILALHIYIDTEFKVSMIGEAYSMFEWIELCDQTHNYWPYYAMWIFALPLALFVVAARYSEKIKISVVLLFAFFLVLDIGSMWAIPYIHKTFFAWVLFLAGNGLALLFGLLFILIMYDMWLRK